MNRGERPAEIDDEPDFPFQRAESETWDVKQWCVDVVFGVGAIGVGVAGLILPVLPGWLAIFAGLLVLAGRIPPLRRALSRLVMTEPTQRFLDRLARNPKTRRLMTRALMQTKIREAVESSARMTVVNALVRNAGSDESAEAE